MSTKAMKHRIIGLFGVFLPIAVLGALAPVRPHTQPQNSHTIVAPPTPAALARPVGATPLSEPVVKNGVKTDAA